MANPALSILIVSYQTRDLTLACLRSILAETRETPFEVVVLDNASSDGSADAIADQHPDVRLLRSGANVGFARGVNEAAKVARGDVLLLLNPDTVVLDGAIDRLFRFLVADPAIGVAGGCTLYGDGRINPQCAWAAPGVWRTFCLVSGLSRLLRGVPAFDSEGMESWRRDSVRDVDIVSGCFLMIRRALWERLGGFDPGFVMYGEDADLCLRAGEAGFRCVINPEARVVHHAGASERHPGDRIVKLFAARVSLLRKHQGPVRAGLGRVLLVAWAGSRALAHALARPFRGKSASAQQAWSMVWRRRRAWLAGTSEELALGGRVDSHVRA